VKKRLPSCFKASTSVGLSLKTKAGRIDLLYSKCYTVIRWWIMINEMSLTPFNKHNCIAMLNTLRLSARDVHNTNISTSRPSRSGRIGAR
jgi:hypothetical protein